MCLHITVQMIQYLQDALQPEATPKRAKEDDDVSLDDEDLPGM